MIKMCKAKATSSGVIWELRKEHYEKYKEDFQLINEYEVMDENERIASELEDKVHTPEEPKKKTKKGK